MTDALNLRLNLESHDLDPASPPTTFRIEELPKKNVGTMWEPAHDYVDVHMCTVHQDEVEDEDGDEVEDEVVFSDE